MNVFRLMIWMGIILILVGLFGATRTVEKTPQSQNVGRIRAQTTWYILSRLGQNLGRTGGVIAITVGGMIIVVGVVGCVNGWDEPDGPES